MEELLTNLGMSVLLVVPGLSLMLVKGATTTVRDCRS